MLIYLVPNAKITRSKICTKFEFIVEMVFQLSNKIIFEQITGNQRLRASQILLTYKLWRISGVLPRF